MTDTGGTAARRERRWLLLSIGSALIGAMAVGVFLALAEDPGPDIWPVMAIAIGLLLVVVGVVSAVILVLRRRGSAWFDRMALWELPRPDRRKVLRAIRKNTPVAPEHVDVALRAAHQLTQRRNVAWVFAAAFVFTAANAVVQDGILRWTSVAAAGCFLIAGAQFYMLCSRAAGAVRVFEQQQRG